jgi:uncharacterized protein (DUF488 family)
LRFLDLLRDSRVTAVADVRSAPVSRFVAHFNKAALAASLAESGIAYIFLGKELGRFLGKELGGRLEQPELFGDGVADYERMAERPSFRHGIERLIKGAGDERIAVMCAEADPVDCHRCLLVGRALVEAGIDVAHTLPSGEFIPHAEIEDRLLGLAGLGEADLILGDRGKRLGEEYGIRAQGGHAARRAPISARGGAVRRG